MKIDKLFVSVNAKDFVSLSEWWTTLLERRWDRQPMPNCHEWDLAGCVHFQVLDNSQDQRKTSVTLHISNLKSEVERLRAEGIDVPDPVKIDGFDTLCYCQFHDPEGNEVGLLEGA